MLQKSHEMAALLGAPSALLHCDAHMRHWISVRFCADIPDALYLDRLFEYNSGGSPERLLVEKLRLLISSEMGAGL